VSTPLPSPLSIPTQLLVIHERLGQWARQLRPRLADRPVRVVETRSAADLEAALSGAGVACPVVLIDLARRVRGGLEDLDRASRAAPDALTLVLDPGAHDGVALLALEIGATHVLAGPTTPPAVANLLARWFSLAQRRCDLYGWTGRASEPTEAEPWDWLTTLLKRGQAP
jgi:hypothetical protein